MSALLFLLLLAVIVMDHAVPIDNDEAMRRLEAKPWYLRDTKIGGKTIPISPITLVIGIISLWNLWRLFLPKKSWAEASHILMEGDDAKKKLEDMRDNQIRNSATQFAKCARQYSACPSKATGGNLGRFKQGDMAPPFDRAVFDRTSSLEKTIGPVETQFGWHLIFIHKRQINE